MSGVERVPIAEIVVGERRREEMGDIAGLASNIDQHGLIHPILLSDDGELIAGERRLRACRSLGWTHIEARRWRVLSEDERRAIELAENLNRKDLTAYERSRSLSRSADLMGAVLREEAASEADFISDSEKKSRMGRPTKPDAINRVAEQLGVGVASLHDATRHVAAADAFPLLQKPDWKQYQALEAKEHLERLPEPERIEAARLIDQPGIPPAEALPILRNLAEMEPTRRDEVFRLNRSDDARDRSRALTTAAAKPPMPDPRLPLLDEAGDLLKRAARLFPEDPETPRIRSATAEVRAVAVVIREGSVHHAQADGTQKIA